MSVALTHHVLGVHPDDAMQDYMLTNVTMRGRTFAGNPGKEGERYASLTKEASKALGGVHEEYLDAAFVAMRDSHGSVDAYMADVLGVDDALRERIRDRLVES